MVISAHAISQTQFKPTRISKSASFVVNGKVEDVFPLFGPIREKEWADGWNPEMIFSNGALAEQHMIFRTKCAAPEDFFTWVITQYDDAHHLVEYTVSTANRIWFINVKCEAAGKTTTATVTYTYTSLNAEGEKLNRLALNRMYRNNLRDWKEAINYYLENGKMLTTP